MKTKKLLVKILVLIGIPVVIVFTIAAGLTLQTVQNSDSTLISNELMAKSKAASYEVNSYFSTYTTIVQQMTANDLLHQYFAKTSQQKQKSGEDGYGSVKNTLNSIAEADPESISSVWIGDCASNTMLLSNEDKPCSVQLSGRPWYKPVTEKRGLLFIEPYTDFSTKKTVMSIVQPIYKHDSGELCGFAGIDITLDRLHDVMKGYKLGNTGYYILASAQNQLIYYPDASMQNKNLAESKMSKNVIQAIQSKKEQLIDFTDRGTTNHGYISTIGTTQWTVTTAMPDAEYFSPFYAALQTMLIVFAVALVILFTLIVLVSKGIVKPLGKLKKVANEVADGNLNVTLDVTSSDEIGQVAAAFKRTVIRLKDYIAYINEITATLNRIASGDLTFTLKCQYTGEFAKLKESLTNIKISLTKLLQNIDCAADQVASGSKQVSNASQALAQGATEQASSIEELSATVTDISQHVSHNAKNAATANEVSKQTSDEIQLSGKLMNQMTDAMTAVKNSSDQISSIVKTIEDIAFQTNILSLNAAVEAARAGEAGKGFAVVAEEVRNLASRSAEAAKSTTALIQEEAQSVQNGTDITEKTAESLQKIVATSQKSSELIAAIADACEKQSISIGQVTQGLEQISAVVQNNSATSEESAASSEELNGQAQELKTQIQKFKIEQQDS